MATVSEILGKISIMNFVYLGKSSNSRYAFFQGPSDIKFSYLDSTNKIAPSELRDNSTENSFIISASNTFAYMCSYKFMSSLASSTSGKEFLYPHLNLCRSCTNIDMVIPSVGMLSNISSFTEYNYIPTESFWTSSSDFYGDIYTVSFKNKQPTIIKKAQCNEGLIVVVVDLQNPYILRYGSSVKIGNFTITNGKDGNYNPYVSFT